MKDYSALKKKDILTYGITWMNLEDIMLSEVRSLCLMSRTSYCMIPLP